VTAVTVMAVSDDTGGLVPLDTDAYDLPDENAPIE
jgi:hypothetical protein